MDRTQYFQRMRETSEVVDPIILDSISPIKNINSELYDFILNMPQLKKRIGKGKLRPFLMRLAYEVCGGGHWEKIKDSCAAVELLNISTYIDNAVFDSKGGIKEREEASNYIIAGRVIRNKASEVLRRDQNLDDRLESLLSEADCDIYIGQYVDLNQIKQEKFYQSIEGFLQVYLDRCYKLTGRFLENIAKMGAILADGSDEQVKNLGNFGKNMGIVVQIINDIGDFVPSKEGIYDVEKVYQDQFNDIKSGKLTLPMYYVLMHGSEENKQSIRKVLGKPNASDVDLEEVTNALIRSGAVDYVKRLAVQYAKTAKDFLRNFEESKPRNYLSMMTAMGRTSKYIARLNQYKHLN